VPSQGFLIVVFWIDEAGAVLGIERKVLVFVAIVVKLLVVGHVFVPLDARIDGLVDQVVLLVGFLQCLGFDQGKAFAVDRVVGGLSLW
jgi:hypothetical protein